jgi:hypothetical protein
MFQNCVAKTIIDFLTDIGIEVIPLRLEQETFLPGILVEKGKLLVDEEKLTYPGDLLHEAGHLAVAPGDLRFSLSGEVLIPGVNMDEIEVQATAWAYAAVVYLGLEPKVLFHEGGYHGKSEGLISTYSFGVYPGAYGLQQIGMTVTGEAARKLGIAPFPNMIKWLRD